MCANAEKTPGVSRFKPEEIIVDFDAERLQAPFLLRCGAFFIDYIVLLAIPVLSLIVGRSFGIDGTKLLTGELSNTGWLVMFLLGLTNFIIFPMFNGQSLGKMLTGLRVVKIDGSAASLSTLLLRHTLGYLVTAGTCGLGFILSAITPLGRSLHDYIASTVVIYARRRVKTESVE
jgi:uncharacterized RDD family membrane protein YckC